MARILINDLIDRPPPATEIPPLGLSAILSLKNAPQDVLDMPLEKFLGLKDGDTLRITPAGPQVVRRDGVVEEINIGR